MLYPVGYLQNTATNRYYPIFFRPAPAPSERSSDSMHRYRSSGHHTNGFDTLELAQEWIKTWTRTKPDMEDTGLVWLWNGEGVPALTEWFTEKTASENHEAITAG